MADPLRDALVAEEASQSQFINDMLITLAGQQSEVEVFYSDWAPVYEWSLKQRIAPVEPIDPFDGALVNGPRL